MTINQIRHRAFREARMAGLNTLTSHAVAAAVGARALTWSREHGRTADEQQIFDQLHADGTLGRIIGEEITHHAQP